MAKGLGEVTLASEDAMLRGLADVTDSSAWSFLLLILKFEEVAAPDMLLPAHFGLFCTFLHLLFDTA